MLSCIFRFHSFAIRVPLIPRLSSRTASIVAAIVPSGSVVPGTVAIISLHLLTSIAEPSSVAVVSVGSSLPHMGDEEIFREDVVRLVGLPYLVIVVDLCGYIRVHVSLQTEIPGRHSDVPTFSIPPSPIGVLDLTVDLFIAACGFETHFDIGIHGIC